jgi:hypothetical protein
MLPVACASLEQSGWRGDASPHGRNATRSQVRSTPGTVNAGDCRYKVVAVVHGTAHYDEGNTDGIRRPITILSLRVCKADAHGGPMVATPAVDGVDAPEPAIVAKGVGSWGSFSPQL